MVVANDALSGVSPRHHVIDGTLKLDSRSSWHPTSGTRAALEFNEKPKTKSDTSGHLAEGRFVTQVPLSDETETQKTEFTAVIGSVLISIADAGTPSNLFTSHHTQKSRIVACGWSDCGAGCSYCWGWS